MSSRGISPQLHSLGFTLDLPLELLSQLGLHILRVGVGIDHRHAVLLISSEEPTAQAELAQAPELSEIDHDPD